MASKSFPSAMGLQTSLEFPEGKSQSITLPMIGMPILPKPMKRWQNSVGVRPEEVAAWRKENGCTWHECPDCRTMQKVPHEIHANIPHEGGISVYKANHEKV